MIVKNKNLFNSFTQNAQIGNDDFGYLEGHVKSLKEGKVIRI